MGLNPMAAERRSMLSNCQALRGIGLEIGAGVRPTITPESDPDVSLRVLDFFTTEQLRANVAKNGKENPDKVVSVDYVSRGEDYREAIGDARFDFIIANHVFEHIVDPIAWLVMLSELLNPEGHLLLTIPEKKRSFDRFRDDTSIAHLLADYFSDAPLSEKARVHTLETIVFYDRSYIGREVTPADAFNVKAMREGAHHPGIHCHVFQGGTFERRILRPLLYTRLVDYSLVAIREVSHWGEFYVVLRKGWQSVELDMEEFYGDAGAASG